MEYVSARFKAVIVAAAMQKPIKEEDSSNENNRKPQRQEQWRNQLESLKWKLLFRNFGLPIFAQPQGLLCSHDITSDSLGIRNHTFSFWYVF